MDNPYRSPDAGDIRPAVSSPWPRRTHAAISILVGLFCAAQFVSVWLLALDMVLNGGAEGFYLQLAGKVLMPFTLALAGVFLAFGRKLSAIFFAAYLVQYVVTFGAFNIPTLVLAFAFLAYATYRWKAGQLSGWPGKR